jgi:transcriptional regulator with XRE-family HTH domain
MTGAFWMELKSLEVLLALMESAGVSQRQLAAVAGYKSHAYMGRLLRGEVKTLDPEPAVRIAHFFKVDLKVLFVSRSSSDPVHVGQRHAEKVPA